MNLNNSTVERDGFDLDRDQAFTLKPLKDSIKHSVLAPPAHARVNGVPVAKLLRQAAPLATVFGNIQDGVKNLKVVLGNIASLAWKTIHDALVLLFGYLHEANITHEGFFAISVNRP